MPIPQDLIQNQITITLSQSGHFRLSIRSPIWIQESKIFLPLSGCLLWGTSLHWPLQDFSEQFRNVTSQIFLEGTLELDVTSKCKSHRLGSTIFRLYLLNLFCRKSSVNGGIQELGKSIILYIHIFHHLKTISETVLYGDPRLSIKQDCLIAPIGISHDAIRYITFHFSVFRWRFLNLNLRHSKLSALHIDYFSSYDEYLFPLLGMEGVWGVGLGIWAGRYSSKQFEIYQYAQFAGWPI